VLKKSSITSGTAEKCIDLDEALEKDHIQLGYYDFTRFASGSDNPGDYGSGFEIRRDGVYLRLPPESIWTSLTEEELRSLAEHPTASLEQPVLPFPFTPRQLRLFFDWARSSGHDVPINEDVLLEVLETKNAYPVHELLISDLNVNQSDMSLGAATRQRNSEFAQRPRDGNEARLKEYKRWYDEAVLIQQKRATRKASLRELANMVRINLGLPDSIETIRKRLAQLNKKEKHLVK